MQCNLVKCLYVVVLKITLLLVRSVCFGVKKGIVNYGARYPKNILLQSDTTRNSVTFFRRKSCVCNNGAG